MKKINSLLVVILLCIGVLLTTKSVAQTAQVDTFNRTINLHDSTWTLSYYVPPSYNPTNKYKLIICLPGLGMTSKAMRNFFLEAITNFDSTGLVNNPASPVYNNAIVVVPNYYFTEIDYDTALVTSCLSDAMSAYNIDPHYIYLSGFSYGGRAALHYGLLNYWRFRGLELYTPAFQSMEEAEDLTSYYYPWQNGRYIPIYMSVGSADVTYPPRVITAYQSLSDSNAIINLQIIYNLGHDPGANSNTFFGFNYVDSHATSYATNDAGISAISAPFGDICSTSFVPVVAIQNKGVGTLTSAIINYQIDNGPINTYNWSGNLIQLGVDKIILPLQTVSTGIHTFKTYTSMPNGVPDNVPSNDTMIESFNSMTNGVDTLTEGFEGTIYPPANWQLKGTDDAWAWQRANGDTGGFSLFTGYPWGGYGKSASSIYFDNSVPDNIGKRYSIRTPEYDFTNSSSPSLTYDYAYAPDDAIYSDTLAVYYSSDCGNIWDTLLVKGGLTLSTTGGYDSTTIFTPSINQWGEQTISLNLPGIIGQPEVMFSFEDRSGWGNLLWLDNISINAITGIANETQEHDSLSVYPNPSSGNITVGFNLNNATNVVIKVYDLQGQVVYSEEKDQSIGNYQTNIDLSNQAKGVYLLGVITDKGMQNKEIIIQ